MKKTLAKIWKCQAKQSLRKKLTKKWRVQKCIRIKIAYANQTGTSVDTVAEQYIELRRALCDTNGVLNKGQKCGNRVP